MPALAADASGSPLWGGLPLRARSRLAAAALVFSLLGAGCAEMDATTRRTVTGAGIGAAGGAVIGSLTGNAGWGALLGAGVGAAGGYLHDRNQRREAEAYRRGLRDGRRGAR